MKPSSFFSYMTVGFYVLLYPKIYIWLVLEGPWPRLFLSPHPRFLRAFCLPVPAHLCHIHFPHSPSRKAAWLLPFPAKEGPAAAQEPWSPEPRGPPALRCQPGAGWQEPRNPHSAGGVPRRPDLLPDLFWALGFPSEQLGLRNPHKSPTSSAWGRKAEGST